MKSLQIQETDLVVAFGRAALDTPSRKKEEGWVARVAPVLSPNLRLGNCLILSLQFHH